MNDETQDNQKIFTRREERVLQLIRNGTMRKARVTLILILLAFLAYSFVAFKGKYDVSAAQMQNACNGNILNLTKIKVSTPLEAKFKAALISDIKIFEQMSRLSSFALVSLILLLFLSIAISLFVTLIITGQRDKLIKKLMGSSPKSQTLN